MNDSHQEASLDTQETEFGADAVTKQRRIIYFSSGETLEVEDSEEEEEEEEEEEDESSVRRSPFEEPSQKKRFSFKNVAFLVGRISLLTCDFLGERLAGALGLTAAKYQYAIDQYRRDRKTNSKDTDGHTEEQAETLHLSAGLDGSHYYGATTDAQQDCGKKHMDTKNEGFQNRGYQGDQDVNLEQN